MIKLRINRGFREIVTESYAKLLAAHMNQDLEEAMSLFCDDICILPQESEILHGKIALRSYLKSFYALTPVETGTFTVEEAFVEQEIGYDISTYELYLHSRKNRIVERGKHMVIWRRIRKAEWRIWRDIYNTSDTHKGNTH